MRRVVVALAAGALAVGVAPWAVAADPQQVVDQVSNQVMSPFCDGLTLQECPSSQATALRERIERWARAGMTKDRIIARLEAQYGSDIRAAPPAEGAGLLAWALPAVVLGAAAVAAWILARRFRAAPGNEPSEEPPAITAAERRRLDEELASLRQGR